MLGKRSQECFIKFENVRNEAKGEKPQEIKWILRELFLCFFVGWSLFLFRCPPQCHLRQEALPGFLFYGCPLSLFPFPNTVALFHALLFIAPVLSEITDMFAYLIIVPLNVSRGALFFFIHTVGDQEIFGDG